MALRLGEALVREGLINNEQLAKALERQVVYGGRLGTNLIELGILTEESLVKFLGNVFGVPYADPKSFEGIKKEVIDTISASLAGKYMVVPIDLEPKRLHLAMLNPTDLRVIDEVRFVTGYEIVPYIASELRLLYALERYYSIQRPVRFISVISELHEKIPVVTAAPVSAMPEMKESEAVAAMEDISYRLVEAKDREEIASIILEVALADLKRVALFVVKSNVIVGWKTVGDQLNDEMLSQIELPLHQPSIFRTVIDGRDFYQGIMPSIPQNMHFLEMMGGEVPQEVIAFPLTIKGKVVCVLYGDNGDRSLLMGDFEELKKVMLKASMALEMLILKKKILEMQGMHCHRHQEREARRRCYRCHQPICSACQARAFHHLFCSRLCIFLYVLSEALRRSLISLAALFAIPPLRAKEGRRWMAPLVFLVLLALAALSLPPRPSLYRGFARPSAEDICYSQSPADLASGADIRPSYLIGSASAQSASAIVPDLQASGKGAEVSHSRPTYRNSSYHRVGEGEGERAEEEAPDISRGDRNRKEMAMTFDGGGWANAALEILDTLHEKGISCTFFLTGEFIRRYPELVKQIVAEGHEVGNHTESHPHLTSFATNSRQELLPGVSRSFLWRELEEAEKLFFEVTGQQMVPYWRAPYGEQNAILRRWAKEIGYQHVSWTSDYRAKKSLDSLDWVADPAERLYCSAEDVRNRILGYGRANGGIVLMHLGTSRRCDQVHERLGEIIEGLQEKGYRLVKISELLEGREGEKQADPGGD